MSSRLQPLENIVGHVAAAKARHLADAQDVVEPGEFFDPVPKVCAVRFTPRSLPVDRRSYVDRDGESGAMRSRTSVVTGRWSDRRVSITLPPKTSTLGETST